MELDYNRDYSLNIENLLIKWLRNDYHTPKVKAEVIIDMLVSEFVTDMIDKKIKGSSKAVLLAKEFPIKGYRKADKPDKHCFTSSKGDQSPAVDYLVMKGSMLYLVELKTDSKSFEHEQLFRMLMTQKLKSKKMFDHYAKVLKSTKEQKKYSAQASNLLKMSGNGELSHDDLRKENKDKISERFSGLHSMNIEVIYLVLGDLIKTDYRLENNEYTYVNGNESISFERIKKKKNSPEWYVNMKTGGDNESIPVTVINMLEMELDNVLWENVKNIINVKDCEGDRCQTGSEYTEAQTRSAGSLLR